MLILLCMACGVTNNSLSKDVDVPKNWTMIQVGNEDYFVKQTKVDYVKQCIQSDQVNPCVENGSNANFLDYNKRPLIHMAKPHEDLMKIKGNGQISMIMMIDPQGEVIMSKLENYSDNVNQDLAKNNAIISLDAWFKKDAKSACLECFRHIIKFDGM